MEIKNINLEELKYGAAYRIEINVEGFTGILSDTTKRIFNDCLLESIVPGNEAEFSFELYDESLDYEDIDDENIICVSQKDLDEGRVTITKKK